MYRCPHCGGMFLWGAIELLNGMRVKKCGKCGHLEPIRCDEKNTEQTSKKET